MPPVATANTVPISGVLAIRSPVSELERCCSAEPRRTHGIAISIAANAATQRQWTSTARRSTRRSATGSRIAVAISVRRNTSTGGRDLGDRDPDEQVRDAPDDRHREEQDQPAPRHRRILARRIDPSFHACGVRRERPVSQACRHREEHAGSRAVAPCRAAIAGDRPAGCPARRPRGTARPQRLVESRHSRAAMTRGDHEQDEADDGPERAAAHRAPADDAGALADPGEADEGDEQGDDESGRAHDDVSGEPCADAGTLVP